MRRWKVGRAANGSRWWSYPEDVRSAEDRVSEHSTQREAFRAAECAAYYYAKRHPEE